MFGIFLRFALGILLLVFSPLVPEDEDGEGDQGACSLTADDAPDETVNQEELHYPAVRNVHTVNFGSVGIHKSHIIVQR